MKTIGISEGKMDLDTVDMTDDIVAEQKPTGTVTNGEIMIDTGTKSGVSSTPQKAIDVEDEAVKDRWSRYIGAMGVEAVAK